MLKLHVKLVLDMFSGLKGQNVSNFRVLKVKILIFFVVQIKIFKFFGFSGPNVALFRQKITTRVIKKRKTVLKLHVKLVLDMFSGLKGQNVSNFRVLKVKILIFLWYRSKFLSFLSFPSNFRVLKVKILIFLWYR